MRRVILAAVSTVAGLALLLSFKTQPGHSAGHPARCDGSPAPEQQPGDHRRLSHHAEQHRRDGGDRDQDGDRHRRGHPLRARAGEDHRHERHRLPPSTPSTTRRTRPQDYEINSYAIPALNQEALAAKSAPDRHDLRRDATPPAATSHRCRAP